MGDVRITQEQLEAQLKAAAEGGAKAALEAMKDFVRPAERPSNDLEDGFNTVEKLRDRAAKMVKPHQYKAFSSPTRAIGVAYILESRRHQNGRVVTFSAYEEPPWEQMAELDGAEPESEMIKGVTVANSRFKSWKYKQYLLADIRAFASDADAGHLMGGCPPRATLEEALRDMDDLRAARDAGYGQLLATKRGEVAQVALPTAIPRALPRTVPIDTVV
jgi:hypothetical protein